MKHLRIDFLLNVFVMLGKETPVQILKPLYVVLYDWGTFVFSPVRKKKIYTPSLSVVRYMLDCFYLVDLVKKKQTNMKP